MIAFFENRFFLIALTFLVFIGARTLQRKLGWTVLHPILMSIILIICFLIVSGVSIDDYAVGGDYIEFWLKPAVVALGVPLYRQLESIRRQLIPLLLAEVAGCVAGIVSVVLVARFLGASQEVILSLVPKAVTTPIAIEISSTIGGIPALTAAVVVCTGIFGGMAGFSMLRLSRVNSPIAGGLSVGTASHAVGTAAAIERYGMRYGAFSSLGLTLNGMLTALLTPLILPWII